MGKVNKSVQKRIEVNKKNKERWREKIKVQENITTKEEEVKEEVIIANDDMLDKGKHIYDYVEDEKKPKIKIEVKGHGKRQRNQSESPKRKEYSILTERVFETRRAQEAEQKRKQQLWRTVERMENSQEGFDR